MSFHNLQQALDYRTECLIHHKPMMPTIYNDRIKHGKKTEAGIEFKYRTSLMDHKEKNAFLDVRFLYDGTMTPKSLHALSSGGDSTTIYMQCEECQQVPLLKSRSPGITTLTDIKHIVHRYYFTILEIDDSFTCSLISESVKYHINDTFYHMSADLIKGAAQLKMGSCDGKELIDQLLDSVMHLDIPKFDATKITTLQQMVDKIKLYNLFS